MKNYNEVKSVVDSLQNEFAEAKSETLRRQLEGQFQKLKPILLILETNPKEETLRKQLEEQKRKLDVIESRYRMWAASNASKHDNPQGAYYSEMGVSAIKARIKVLEQILL